MAGDKPDSYQCGPFEVARKPDVQQFVDKLNRLREAVDQCRLQDGVGYTVNRSSGGTTLAIRSGASAVAQDRYPWKVSVGYSKDMDSYFFTVEPESHLGSYGPGADSSGNMPPKNLNEKVPLNTKTLSDKYYAVLQVNTDPDAGSTDASLLALKAGDYPGLVVPQDGPQKQSNTILATITTSGAVIQNVRGDLTEALVNIGGFPYVIPVTQAMGQ